MAKKQQDEMLHAYNDYYKFNLTFKGDLVENSVDAFDLANTILAISQALNQISSIKYESTSSKVKINVNAFSRGSFISEILIYVEQGKDLIVPLFPILGTGYKIGKDILSSLKMYLDVRQMLKGRPPSKVEHNNDGVVIYGNNTQIFVTHNDFRVIQDKSVSKSLDKAVQPLLKDDSEINEVSITENGQDIASVDRQAAQYLRENESFQTINNFKIKGLVTKIDTKTCKGFLNLGDIRTGRRISFSFQLSLPKEKLHILIESLESKIKIYLHGQSVMDYEGNPRSIDVIDITQDEDLFR